MNNKKKQVQKEEQWTPVKISSYNKKIALVRIGYGKPFPSLQQLVNTALREFYENHPYGLEVAQSN